MSAQPTTTSTSSKQARWEDVVSAINAELGKYVGDSRLDDIVARAPKVYRFEAEQLRAALGTVGYWLAQLASADNG